MPTRKRPESEQNFIEVIRQLEERLFADQLDDKDPTRMHSPGYSWYYRPSHHIKTGLITERDIEELSKPGKRVLSVGANPANLEQVLCELGVPAENILIADKDPAVANSGGQMEKIIFDATEPWPEIGTFDLIIFPESLCISLTDNIKKAEPHLSQQSETAFPNDALEAELLAVVLSQALQRLRRGGDIRANGPMSHPNVVHSMSEKLLEQGYLHTVEYHRFFLTVRHKE